MEYLVRFKKGDLSIREKAGNYPVNLDERFLQFAVDVVKFMIRLPKIREMDVFRNQLSKSSTSIGANYSESQAGSFAEFKQRIQICLREAKETYYWFRVIQKLEISKENNFQLELKRLTQESKEIQLILGSISAKIKNK